MYQNIMTKLRNVDRNTVLIGVAVFAVLVTGVLVSNKNLSTQVLSFLKFSPSMSNEAIAKKAVDYLNTSVLQNGQTATVESVSRQSGLVKLKLKIGTSTYDSYATTDGNLLFPEAFDLSGATNTTASTDTTGATTAQVTPDNVAKVAKTSLEAFVVSDCPFGLQADRAITQAVKTAPAVADSVKIRFIGSVTGTTLSSMHDSQPYDVKAKTGGKEAEENLRQMCLREQQPAKFYNYLACYMEKATGALPNSMPTGDSAGCLTKTGVDVAKVNACMSDPAQGLAYAKADFALASKYGVQGSPTFILNGKDVAETPFGGRSAKGIGQMICSSSKTPPAFCKDANFSVDPAATSFSVTYAGAGATGATANCAPSV